MGHRAKLLLISIVCAGGGACLGHFGLSDASLFSVVHALACTVCDVGVLRGAHKYPDLFLHFVLRFGVCSNVVQAMLFFFV